MKKALVLGITLACVALFVGGCSKGFNVFAPLTPAPGTLPVSISNAANAYAAGDYAGAMAMYQQLMASNPQSSEAKYGYVKSYVKSVGLDIGTFLKNGTGHGAPPFSAPVAGIAKGPVLDSQTDPFGINVAKMQNLSNNLITYLGPIADGLCDGVIPANDVDVNASLAFAYLLRGVFKVVDPASTGVLQFNIYDFGNGNVKVVLWGKTTIVSSNPLIAVIKSSALADIDKAIGYLHVANTTAGGGTIWDSVANFLTYVRGAIVAG